MSTAPTSLWIVNARLLDGTGSPPQTSCAIGIRDGRIAHIAPQPPTSAEPRIDVSGATVVPGLIDPHVHLQSVPGAAYRGDDEEARRRARFHHLRAYLACGVTTVLDAAIATDVLREIQDYLAAGGVGPRVLALAPALYPPGGYLDHGFLTNAWGSMWRPAATRNDVCELFDEYAGIDGIVGVKCFVEFGFSPFWDWPIHTPQMRAIIREESADRGLPIYVHAIQHRAHEIAMELEPRALVHSGFLDRQPSNDLIAGLKTCGTTLMSTLGSLFDCLLQRRALLRGVDDPLLRLTVPEAQAATVQDRRAWRFTWLGLLAMSAPRWVPGGMIATFGRLLPKALPEHGLRRGFRAACRAVAALHEAGVPVAAGTDSGAWPLFPSCFHGPSTPRELELLATEVGLPPLAILQSATRIPAELLGLGADTGTIEVGKRADLVVLRDDPLTDPRAYRNVLWTVKDGVARRPNEWMQLACGVD